MRFAAFLASATVLALSIVSTTFVYLALNSTEWSTQSYYFALNGQSDGTNETTAVCTAGRSPFYRCGIPVVDANGACTIPACSFYRPYGKNATSCRSPTELGIAVNDDVSANGLLGGEMECQQVHYAGNLQIAASVFITLGLACSLILFGLAAAPRAIRGSEEPVNDEATNDEAAREQRRDPRHRHRHRHRRAGLTSFVVFSLLLFLLIGAVLQILAQFFGVLGLTVNATPSAASAPLYQYQNGDNNFVAHDWIINSGLGAYATTVWTTALASAFLAGTVFSTPAFPKYSVAYSWREKA